MRRRNILEESGNEDASPQRKERNTSSVGFWENLGQKGVKRILKVVIVSFLYFIP